MQRAAPWWHSLGWLVSSFTRIILSFLTSHSFFLSILKPFMFAGGNQEARGEKLVVYSGLVINHWFWSSEFVPFRISWNVEIFMSSAPWPSFVIPDRDVGEESKHHAGPTPHFPAFGHIRVNWISRQPTCHHRCSVIFGDIQEIAGNALFINCLMGGCKVIIANHDMQTGRAIVQL